MRARARGRAHVCTRALVHRARHTRAHTRDRALASARVRALALEVSGALPTRARRHVRVRRL